MLLIRHTNELSKDLRFRIVELHKAAKGSRSISKSRDVHQSFFREKIKQTLDIILKWLCFICCYSPSEWPSCEDYFKNTVQKDQWSDKEAKSVCKRLAEISGIGLSFFTGRSTIDDPKHYGFICSEYILPKVVFLWMNTKHFGTPTPKPKSSCEIWWREHHDFGMLCLRAQTACY